MKREVETVKVEVTDLVIGGQGLGVLPNGKKVFIWNALPGEVVMARPIRQKSKYAEAIAVDVVKRSPDRVEPIEENYMATSPWQILDWEKENSYKKNITVEMMSRKGLIFPEPEIVFTNQQWQYRNKMEYSFWGNNDGLHLALHKRGSHNKDIVSGSVLAMPAIDIAANAVCAQLSESNIRASELKTIVIRCDRKGKVAASLFVKSLKFKRLNLPPEIVGLNVYHSDPRSPASVQTKFLYQLGNTRLNDTLLGNTFVYDVDSFFQVNLPIYEKALKRIKELCQADDIVDMYAGVGSIGLSVARRSLELVELDSASAAMARENAKNSQLKVEVVEASTDDTIQSIVSNKPIIFDPPRTGLHPKLIGRLLEVMPKQVVYLSCNPTTQARDLALLKDKYKIKFLEIYNFFPRTPHIETLAVLEHKS